MTVQRLEDLEAANVLCQSPSLADVVEEICSPMMADGGPVIGVTTAHTPDRWLDTYLDSLPTTSSDIRLVCVGERTRAGPSMAEPASHGTQSSITLSTVESPANLTQLGTTLTECFADLSASAGDPVMCFDSVSTLLRHAGTQSVFQFLHTLSVLVAKHGAQAHYHLDPSAHDDRDVAALKLIVDAVVTVSPDGISVETR